MKKILLLVFSGTGNTLTVAKMIREYFEKNDASVQIRNVEKPFEPPENINEYHIVGFGYPVHAFNIPRIYRKFIKCLPAVRNIPAFIFKTSGEPFRLNNASSYILTRKLRKKGFDIYSDTHFLMPYNIIFRYPERAVADMIYYARRLSAIVVYNMMILKKNRLKYRWHHRLISAIFRIQYLGAALNGRLIKVNRDRCVGCRRCLINCPTGNISIKNNILKFSGKCTMCMRCVMMCPNDAITIGFLNKWKVNGAYDFQKYLNSENPKNGFFFEKRRGFFRHFKKYYERLESMINTYKLRN